MEVKEIIQKLKKKYPGKNIILNDPDNPTEIICEIEPASLNPDKSVSVAVFDGKIRHSHAFRDVVYEVLEGNLEITKAGKTYFLSLGEKIEIDPGEYHLAKGNETWVKVTSTPAWLPEEYVVRE